MTGRGAPAVTAGTPGSRGSADDLAALLLALGLGHLEHALALARVLAGAAVAPRVSAPALALALVDADALHVVTARLVLGAGLDGAARQQRRCGGCDQDSLVHAIHESLLVSPRTGVIGLP